MAVAAMDVTLPGPQHTRASSLAVVLRPAAVVLMGNDEGGMPRSQGGRQICTVHNCPKQVEKTTRLH
jgi:hypothetical protein